MVDPKNFRSVLGRLPTGVVVVTLFGNDQASSTDSADLSKAEGVTIGSFTSISLAPPLVGFFIGQDSSIVANLKLGRPFGVNVLSSDQAEISDLFASRTVDKFAGVPTRVTTHLAVPHIVGATAVIECVTDRIEPYGDHSLVVGEVIALTGNQDLNTDLTPLVFWQGQYSTVAPVSD